MIVTEDNRVIVKREVPANTFKPTTIRKKTTGIIVHCPHCGAEIPYSAICKQFNYKTKYNRSILRRIIMEKRKLTTGELARRYQEVMRTHIQIRTLGYIVREFCAQGFVETRIRSNGRYGRSTEICIARLKRK